MALALGLSVSATSHVARRIGERDRRAAGLAAGQTITAALAVALLCGAPAAAAAPQLLRWMGASPQVITIGSGFASIALGFSGVLVLLSVINAIFRGAGDAALAMRVLWIANAINIALNPCLIYGLGPFPELGLNGSATATVIGRSVGVLLQIRALRRGTRIQIRLSDLYPRLTVMRSILNVAWTGAFQHLIGMASWMGLTRLAAEFGSAALAANTIAIRIVLFTILPSWGLSNAAATLVGQNLGARKPDRSEAAVRRCGFYNMLFLGALGLIFTLSADSLIRLFTTDPAVLALGASALRLMSYGYPFYAWGMILEQAFNGAGDTRTPTLINLFCYWLLQLPLAYVLAQYWLGPQGLFLAITVAESALALLAYLAFRRGHWKQVRI